MVSTSADVWRNRALGAAGAVLLGGLVVWFLRPPAQSGGALAQFPSIAEDIDRWAEAQPADGRGCEELVTAADPLAAAAEVQPAQQALELYRQALVNDQDCLSALLGIASLYPTLAPEAHPDVMLSKVVGYTETYIDLRPADLLGYRVRGRVLEYIQSWHLAREAWQHVLSQQPGDEEALLSLGWAAHGQGELERAAELFREAADASAESPVPLLWLARTRRDQGALGDALEVIEEAYGSVGRTPELLLLEGDILDGIGSVPAAAEAWQEAAEGEGGAAVRAALSAGIDRYQRLRELGAAAELLDGVLARAELVDLDEEAWARARLHRAIVRRLTGRSRESVNELARLREERADDEAVLFQYARSLLAMGDIEGGITRDLARYLDNNDGSPALITLAAEIAASRGDLGRASTLLERAHGPDDGLYLPAAVVQLAVASEYPTTTEMRALVRRIGERSPLDWVLDDPDPDYYNPIAWHAIEGPFKALSARMERESPLDSAFLALPSYVGVAQQSLARAEPFLDRLAELEPSRAEPMVLLGLVAWAEGALRTAASAAVRARRADGMDREALYLFGRLKEVDGSLDEAQEAFDRILGTRPRSPLGLHGRGRLHHRAGRRREALRDYRAALAADDDFLPARRDLVRLQTNQPPEAGWLVPARLQPAVEELEEKLPPGEELRQAVEEARGAWSGEEPFDRDTWLRAHLAQQPAEARPQDPEQQGNHKPVGVPDDSYELVFDTP